MDRSLANEFIRKYSEIEYKYLYKIGKAIHEIIYTHLLNGTNAIPNNRIYINILLCKKKEQKTPIHPIIQFVTIFFFSKRISTTE